MNMLHLTQADYLTTLWSGGTTTQIAIFPSDTPYSTRDFLWRVSSAVVTDEKSIFTPLPDYNRRLMLLDGSLLLRHNGGAPFRLDAYQVHAFDGGAAGTSTLCSGRGSAAASCGQYALREQVRNPCRFPALPPAAPTTRSSSIVPPDTRKYLWLAAFVPWRRVRAYWKRMP